MEAYRPLRSVIGCIVILASCALLLSGVSHSESYQSVTTWGSYGPGDGQLSNPHGLAIDSSGNIYVADTGNRRIQKFTSVGAFLTKWGSAGSGNGQFAAPAGVALDSLGNVYVADGENCSIQKFTSDGLFLTRWGSKGSENGQLSNPQGLAVDSSGNVYVADQGNDRIQKFTSDGIFLTRWGSKGSENGQFFSPLGLAVDSSGNVYVADSGNKRIQKFTSTGTFITKWGSQGPGDGQFMWPQGLALDSSGNVYVADSGNRRIKKFTSTGTFITKWGLQGPEDVPFDPRYVATGSSNDVYATEGPGRIQVFAPHSPNPTLTIIKSGNGSGTVTSAVPGINCGVTCTASYPLGTVVTLTSTVDADSYFLGWSAPCSGNSPCDATVTGNTRITASFGLARTAYYDTVQQVYVGYYQRPADPLGLLYWAERLSTTNGDLTEIIESYAHSEESQALYGTIDSTNIANVVDAIYSALFNRHAEAGGLAWYVNGFNSGQYTAATIMLDVLYGAQNEDLRSINNKLIASNRFTRTIDPELDGTNFQHPYSGDEIARRARLFLSAVTSDPTTIPTEDVIRGFF